MNSPFVLHRRMETPFVVKKSKVYKFFDLEGNFVGYGRKLTNKEKKNCNLPKHKKDFWIEVKNWELK